MSTRLRLLDEVSFEGRVVAGGRNHALLAVLAAARGAAVPDADIVEAVWGHDERPAHPAKALQVVVSRVRAQTARDVVGRVESGYRLGLRSDDVDAASQVALTQAAQRAERDGDPAAAREAARAALDLRVASPGEEAPALEELREVARLHRDTVDAVLGRALSALGDHAEALELLEVVLDPDETTLATLLRSEAAVRGAPAALARYEHHREQLRDRLGVDPGPALQAVHADLVASDRPVRDGVLHEASSLVGREDDLRALRALVRGSRVVSVLGPGGLGKTRLAHLLGRDAEQSVVHLVELVGVATGDDVVGEVGSALGVRDSVSGRRRLTPEQRRDVRSRIAHHLDRSPTLLILDNCEHVVEAVADLVAFLVAAAPRLRVLTTTRAALGIAAEHVFALSQLDEQAAVELFVQRATAARPGAVLDTSTDGPVRSVVRRLDGLPLAIELASAKVRAMSLTEIDRRLDDRFALLRGSDATVPDRHRTLMAVIDWSWDLLAAPQQAALSRLALFPDGFDLDAAEAVLDEDAVGSVEALVGQSLLTVRESSSSLRYRMLETVREFGIHHLADDEPIARAAVRRWALDLARSVHDDLAGADQVRAVRRLAGEDVNLTDILREALVEPDPPAVAVLLAALGGSWTIRGEHVRMVAMIGAVEKALEGWTPPPELVGVAARAAGMMAMNAVVTAMPVPTTARALMAAAPADDAELHALQRVFLAIEHPERHDQLRLLVDGPDRAAAVLALQWLGHEQENKGSSEAAVASLDQALTRWRPEDGVWSRALVRTQLAVLHAQRGENAEASLLAAAALPDLEALDARDDAAQLRSVLACAAILEGRIEDAEGHLADMAYQAGGVGAANVVGSTRAELALARGDVASGLALYDETVTQARSMRFPGLWVDTGLEPWTLFVQSGALCAQARYGDGSGAALSEELGAKTGDLLAVGARHREHGDIDHPLVGCALFALGVWELRVGHPGAAIALVAVAHRFGYSQYLPSMSWARIHAELEQAAPGALDAAVAAYGERRGPQVVADARALLARR